MADKIKLWVSIKGDKEGAWEQKWQGNQAGLLCNGKPLYANMNNMNFRKSFVLWSFCGLVAPLCNRLQSEHLLCGHRKCVEQHTDSTPSELKEDEKQVSLQEAWDPNPSKMKVMVGESTALHVMRGDIKEDTVESLPIVKKDIKEKINCSRSKVSFDKSPQAAAALRNTRHSDLVYEGRDGQMDGHECVRRKEGHGNIDDVRGEKDSCDLELGTRRYVHNRWSVSMVEQLSSL